MNTKLPLILAAFGSFWILPLHAQTTLTGDHVVEGELEVGKSNDRKSFTVYGETGSSAGPGIHVSGDGGVLFEGTYGQGQIPMEGPGVRFMWYPAKAALRVGKAYSTEWNDNLIGNYSVAFGDEVRASGNYSVAMGLTSEALGNHAIAMGNGSWAAAHSSIALQVGYAYGNYSFGAIGGYADGNYSMAIAGSDALGNLSFAFGHAMTIGDRTFAAGQVTAYGFRSVVVGSFNQMLASSESTDTWVETDSIFVIGNGENIGNPSNALTVLKNGRTTLENKFWDDQDPLAVPTATGSTDGDALVVKGHSKLNGNLHVAGRIVIEPQGDLSMGSFTSSP